MKRTPLRPGKPLARRTRLKAKGRSRFPKRRNPEYVARIRTLPCVVTGLRTGEWITGRDDGDWRIRVEAAHLKSRGAGGDDVGNTVPLDWRLHRTLHQIGQRAFEAKYGVDLKAEAARLAAQWEQGER